MPTLKPEPLLCTSRHAASKRRMSQRPACNKHRRKRSDTLIRYLQVQALMDSPMASKRQRRSMSGGSSAKPRHRDAKCQLSHALAVCGGITCSGGVWRHPPYASNCSKASV